MDTGIDELRGRLEAIRARVPEGCASVPAEDVCQLRQALQDCCDSLEAARLEFQSEADRHARILAAVQAGPLVVFVWRIAEGWPVEFASESVRRFGYTPEEFLSGEVSWPGITHPDDITRLEAEVAGYLREGVDEFFQEYRLIAKNGVVRWVDDCTIAIKDKDGNTTHFTGAIRDITERKAAEAEIHRLNAELESRVFSRTAELRESERKYRQLSDHTQDIHFTITSDGIVTYVGPQVSRYGYLAEDFLGKPCTEFVAPQDRERLLAALQRMIARGENPPSDYRFPDAAGEVNWMEERSTVERDETGKVVGMTGVLRDVTARKHAEMRLKESQKRLRRLAARLASAEDHEQRRIAEVLHDGVAQVLAACSFKLAMACRTEDPEARTRILDDADKLLGEAQASIRFLSFELASSTLYRLGLSDAIRELCDGIFDRYGLVFDTEGSVPQSQIDDASATVVFKAVRELVFNVIKHAHVDRGRIVLGTANGYVHISVKDQGRGFEFLPGEDIAGSGDGYGLFSIQERLRDLGGRMEVSSVPNVETCVTLWLPLASQDGPAGPPVGKGEGNE